MADTTHRSRPTALRCALPLLLGALIGAPSSLAQEPTDEPAAQEQRSELERDLERVLHLASGQVIRARARLAGDSWEYRARNRWQSLPADLVVRHKTTREILAQARRLERELEDGDHGRRVAYADWLASEGLQQECYDELESVLRDAPDQPQAVDLITRLDLEIGLPRLNAEGEELHTQVDALIRAAAPLGPAARELAILELGALGEEYPLEAQLSEALHHSSPKRRRMAAHSLRRLFPGEQIRPLISRSILDPSEDVRVASALAIKATGEQALILPALRALESQHSTVRTHAAEALGTMGFPVAVPALMASLNNAPAAAPIGGGGGASPRSYIFVGKQFAYIQDFDVEVAQFEAVADPVINTLVEGAVLDVRVLSVQIYSSPIERARVRGALRQLTGANPGNTVRAWNSWYSEHGADFGSSDGSSDGSGE